MEQDVNTCDGGRNYQEAMRRMDYLQDRLRKKIKKEAIMHYRNGREAKNGDVIVQLSMDDSGNINALGVLYNATPGNDYCNGQIAPVQATGTGACMCDCLHIEDLAAILKEKGLHTRPAGK